MAIRKRTIRHLSLVARKIAKLVNGVKSSRRPKYLLLNIQDLEHDLIPRIYREAKRQGLRMTKWVNGVIERALPENEEDQETNERNFRKEKTNHE